MKNLPLPLKNLGGHREGSQKTDLLPNQEEKQDDLDLDLLGLTMGTDLQGSAMSDGEDDT